MSNPIHSQHEEQHILEKIITGFDVKRTAVEIGINTGAKGDGKTLQGNTVFLETRGWQCLWIDANTVYPGVVKKTVYPENIVQILQENLSNKQIGIFSVDIDGEDWHVIKSVLESDYNIDVFVCEANSYLDPLQDLVMPLGHRRTTRSKSICHGATLTAFNNLLSRFDYNFYCTSLLGTNGFWIKKSLLPRAVSIDLFRDHRHPLTTKWSRSSKTDTWLSSENLLS
jgi:hypothetical protein